MTTFCRAPRESQRQPREGPSGPPGAVHFRSSVLHLRSFVMHVAGGYPSAMLDIVNNEVARRWEARLDGELAGYVEYRPARGRITFTHTVVEPRFEGRGIASRLARAALDAAVALELRIIPRCPFISAYLERHPEYAASVDWPARRSAAG